MCLAIYKPNGVEIAQRYLRHGFHNNMDGAGFAVCINNKIAIFKGYTTFDSFMEAYKPHATRAAIIHFRIATHGETTTKNCHPFGLHDNRYALIHNGIINIDTKFQKEMSDTWHFAELVLSPMLKTLAFDHPALKYLIETSIGSFNKIVMLRGDGAHMIFNERHGAWNKGAWFSNDSYKHGYVWQTSTKYIETAWDDVKAKFPGYQSKPWDDDEDYDSAAINKVIEAKIEADALAEDKAEIDEAQLQAERDWTAGLKRHGLENAAELFEDGRLAALIKS